MGVARLEAETGLPIRWTPFPLHPEIPEQGQSLEDLFRGRLDVGAMLARLGRTAADLGLPFGERTHTYNSRRAQELGLWADSLGAGEAWRDAVFRAYFRDGHNIARLDVLETLAGDCGLDAGEARRVCEADRFGGAVEGAWARARRLGVEAVPTHLRDGRLLVGYRPYPELAAFAAAADAPQA